MRMRREKKMMKRWIKLLLLRLLLSLLILICMVRQAVILMLKSWRGRRRLMQMIKMKMSNLLPKKKRMVIKMQNLHERRSSEIMMRKLRLELILLK